MGSISAGVASFFKSLTCDWEEVKDLLLKIGDNLAFLVGYIINKVLQGLPVAKGISDSFHEGMCCAVH